MALLPGTKLGPYEILSLLGAGGMGEVYKARDQRLDRIVAIKALPAHLSMNPDLKQRFVREAKAISNLNHPNICTLYDVGQQDGMDFLIIEYLDGETLADRLKKGAMPIQQSLTLSVQIADALDKAHRAGIVHRDLKPGNIMITKSGVKLLDFGLAKFQSSGADQIASGLSALATQGKDLTAEGTILGTLQYMSPEQLEGKDVDTRTDIFSFGAVIYEMLTGKKAFEGKSSASLIAAILEKNPVPVNEIQPMTPPVLDRIVRKCLEKDPEQRWQSAADLASELKWAGEDSQQSTALLSTKKTREKLLPWVFASGLAIAGAFMLNYLNSSRHPPSEIVAPVIKGDLEVALDSPVVGGSVRMAISPDGKTLAYVGTDSDQKTDLYIRQLDRWSSQKLDGTEGARQPFFSPDSQWIGFFADGKLKKISVNGGTCLTLYDRVTNPRGATWGANNTIIFSDLISGLKSIHANGGELSEITKLNPGKLERSHRWPQFMPDGKTVLFTVQTGTTSFDDASIEAVILVTGKRHVIYKGGTYAKYAKGQLIFCRNAVLYAAPLDEKTFQLARKPVAALEGVVYDSRSGATQYAFSDSGTLVYQKGSTLFADGKLLWIDMKGTTSSLLDQPAAYLNPRFSPNGEQLAMQIGDVRSEDIWIYHSGRRTLSRLTFNTGQDVCPVWTPDGQRITYSSWRDNKPYICEIRADGSGEDKVIYQPPPQQWVIFVPNSWSPDGRYLTISGTSDKTNLESEIFIFDRITGKTEPFFTSHSAFGRDAVFSPNGRWIAYTTGYETGRGVNIYVRPFDNSGGTWQVSPNQGYSPRWSFDGRQLFYREVGSPSKLWAVDVNSSGKSFEAGPPRLLFSGEFGADPFYLTYDVHPDGKRFVIWQPTTTTATTHLQFVSNWFTELK